MKNKSKIVSFAVAVALVVSSCSSGSSSESDTSVLTKNGALPENTATKGNAPDLAAQILSTPTAPSKSSSSNSAPLTKNGALPANSGKVKAKSSAKSSDPVSASVIVDFQERVFLPSQLCSLMGLNCDVLDFAQITVSGPTSYVAKATIPNSSIKLPAGNGYGFAVKTTALQIAAEGTDFQYSVIADVELTLGGATVPLSLVGTYAPSEGTISIEMSNNKVNLKNAMGIPGFDILTITAKNTFVGGVPVGVGLSVSGTLPTFLKELGVNPNTPFRAAFEVGVGVTIGMSVGSQEAGAPNIISLKGVVSASFLQASFSTVGTTIAGVEYRKGLHLIFEGKFGKTPVMVDGSIASYIEYEIEFNIGAFDLAGFAFEETKGKIVRSTSGLELGFSGGLKGYGIEGRMFGKFDPMGGIELLGEGGFKPAGVDLGSMKFNFVANKSGVKFIGSGYQNFGVVAGKTTVGFKSFPNNKAGFTMEVESGLQIPGMPSYASVSGALAITNCPGMTCSTPTAVPTAKISGSASFYKQPSQSFTFVVNPNNWGFREELKFKYDKNLGYNSNGFEVGVRAWGEGSVVISNTGISFGKGSLNASAGFRTPDVRVPPVTVVETKTRLYKTVCSGRGFNWRCRQEGYWSYAGGQTITPAFTIPGVDVKLSAGVGIDNKGFYVEVQAGKEVSGAKLYFPA